jgi:hypothetical protein
MWPGRRFAAPYFIHYGKNGGNVSYDGADRYVYAISNNGFWNDGDDVIIGRVERKKLPNMNASDWTYLKANDGAVETNWTPQLDLAKPIFSLPGKCGTTSPCYVPSLGVYVMVVWYNPVKLHSWFNPKEMKYDFYQAEHAWGPWNFISSCSDKFIVGGHWYGPTLCAKFQQRSGPDVTMCPFNSGCPFEDQPTGIYKAWEFPIVLKTTPLIPSVMVNDDDSRIRYAGKWTASRGRKYSDYAGDVQFTNTPGDSMEFTFNGSGIDYLTEKYKDEGDVSVSIDGGPAQTVSLKMINFPRLTQITVFRVQGLAERNHTIRVVNKSDDFAVVDGFKVYGSPAAP